MSVYLVRPLPGLITKRQSKLAEPRESGSHRIQMWIVGMYCYGGMTGITSLTRERPLVSRLLVKLVKQELPLLTFTSVSKPIDATLKPHTVEARKLEHHYPRALKVTYRQSQQESSSIDVPTFWGSLFGLEQRGCFGCWHHWHLKLRRRKTLGRGQKSYHQEADTHHRTSCKWR